MTGLWIFPYPVLFIHLDEKGTKKWQEAQEGKLNMVASDQFSILPALLMPKEGLSEALVWGRFGWVFATSGEQPGPSSLERKKYKNL